MYNNNQKNGATTLQKVGRIIRITVKGVWYSFWALSGIACIILVGVLTFSKEKKCNLTSRYALYKYECRDAYRIKDIRSGKWITGNLASVDNTFYSDSLIRFSKRNIFNDKVLFGYIDIRNGKVAIKPQFDNAGEFSEGQAAVAIGDDMGFIDINGVLCYEFKHKLRDIDCITLINGYAIVESTDSEGRYGIINSKGEFLLEPHHFCIDNAFSDTFIVSEEIDKQGIWSASKGWIVEPSKLMIDYNCCAERFSVIDNGFAYEIDHEGKITNPFVFTSAEQITYTPLGGCSEEEVATEYLRFSTHDGCYGLYNSLTRELILPAKYSSIYMISKDLFVVSYSHFGSEFFVDKNGKVVIPKNAPKPIK